MNHFTAAEFWSAYDSLPATVRRSADRSFAKLKSDPFHASLHFKQIGRYWSARVGIHYRAVAVRKNDDLVWFWIGPHADYDRLIRQKR